MKRLALLALIVIGFWPVAGDGVAPRAGLVERLLGPVASLAASVWWVRFDLALREGDAGRAYALAERALDLDPGAWQGWTNLGLHLVFDRASPELEPEPAERRRWIEAGLAVLARGAAEARRPEELHLAAGLVRAAYVGPQAEALGWPDGARGALREALADLERARELGSERAAGLADEARDMLARLARGERPPSWAEQAERR